MSDFRNAPPPSVVLEDEAIERWVHLTSGNATDADRLAFQAWCHISPAHQAAADVVEQLWQGLGEGAQHCDEAPAAQRQAVPAAATAVAPAAASSATPADARTPTTAPGAASPAIPVAAPATPAPTTPSPAPRRRLQRWAALAACLATVAFLGLQQPARLLLADQSTATGERRTLTLEDGSQVWLNSASAIDIDYSPQRRRIILIQGEALFQVSKDAARPFVVRAGDGEVQAVGTRFDVDLQPAQVNVGVAEGIVQVTSGGQQVRLSQAQQLHYRAGQAPSPISAFDAGSDAAWQRGKLIFNRTTLAEVFHRTERYLPGALVISGRLPDNPVSGVFDLNDLPAMLDVLARTQPVRVIRLPWLTLVMNDAEK